MDVTKEQIKQWKAKYKEVFVLRVDDKVAYLRTPDRATLSYASTLATKDPMKFNEAILTNCWLEEMKRLKLMMHFSFRQAVSLAN